MLLGPDNGLLAPAVAMLGGATEWSSLTNTDYQLPSPGPTFAGRDVLAPAVGHLAAGVPLAELGEEVDAVGLVPGLVSLPQHDDGGAIAGEVWWVDRFGNCQLNIDPEELAAHGAVKGEPVEVRFGDQVRSARWVETYADAKPSRVGCRRRLVRARRRSRSIDSRPRRECKFRVGSGVTLVPPGASPPRRGPPTPPQLMRPGTTIVIALLLLAIFAAAFAQFVLRLGP